MSGEERIRSRAGLLSRPVRVFSVLILTIFLAELVVMMSFGVFLPELSQAAATLLDATLLTVLIAPVLWFVVARPAACATCASTGRWW